MYLKWIKLANSIRVGNKEEIFLEAKRYDLLLILQGNGNLILVRDKTDHKNHAVTSMANVIYTDTEDFPHHFFEDDTPLTQGFPAELKPKKANERTKPSKTAVTN